MIWNLASLQQLYQIIYDEPCELHLKLAAKQELERRKKQKYGRKNWKRKEHHAGA